MVVMVYRLLPVIVSALWAIQLSFLAPHRTSDTCPHLLPITTSAVVFLCVVQREKFKYSVLLLLLMGPFVQHVLTMIIIFIRDLT